MPFTYSPRWRRASATPLRTPPARGEPPEPFGGGSPELVDDRLVVEVEVDGVLVDVVLLVVVLAGATTIVAFM